MQRARRAKLNRMPLAVHVDVRNDLHAQENAYDVKCISLSVMDFRYRSEPISSRPAGQSSVHKGGQEKAYILPLILIFSI